MDNIIAISQMNTNRAKEIIEDTKIIELWESTGARINLVGSLKTGLMMKTLDVDFHIYSDNFSIAGSFEAIKNLAMNSRIKRIEYTNLLNTDEMCLEWHAWYLDKDNQSWHIDMIHILNESPYAGWFEKVADRIKAVLTPETKYAILSIKNDIPLDKKISSVEVYQAVISNGVRNYGEFMKWKENNNCKDTMGWMP